jgi:hypothetical protein
MYTFRAPSGLLPNIMGSYATSGASVVLGSEVWIIVMLVFLMVGNS